MSSGNSRHARESMRDLAEQKKAYLESELNQVRHSINEAKKWGYDVIEFQMALTTPFKWYFGLILILFVCIGFYEELTVKNTTLNKWVKAKLGHHDFHTYLADESRQHELPVDDEVPECDYRTMTPKRFFNDYVKMNRPCLFKGYG